MDKKCKDEIKMNLEGVKLAFESLHGQSKTGVINMNSSDNSVRLVQTALNDYAGKMERGSKQCVDIYNNEYNRAVDEYKSAQEKYDKAKKTYDDAEAAKVLASKKADDAKNNIPPQEVERFVETSGAVLLRDGSVVLDGIVEKLLPLGGVVFIDEAHQLFPNRTTSEKGTTITIIITITITITISITISITITITISITITITISITITITITIPKACQSYIDY